MPIFLTADQLYRVIQRELPPGQVYPDGPASAFFSTADSYATAKVFADAYASQRNIYENYFPMTTTDRIADWEWMFFGHYLDASLPLATRRADVIAKLRAQGGIRLVDIEYVIASVLGPGVLFKVLPWGGNGQGAWILDQSLLGIDTWLALEDPIYGTGRGAGQTAIGNSLDYASAGITYQDLENIQRTAYLYEVLIFANASAETLAALDAALSYAEPARSAHLIYNNVSAAAPDPAIYGWSNSFLPWWKS